MRKSPKWAAAGEMALLMQFRAMKAPRAIVKSQQVWVLYLYRRITHRQMIALRMPFEPEV